MFLLRFVLPLLMLTATITSNAVAQISISPEIGFMYDRLTLHLLSNRFEEEKYDEVGLYMGVMASVPVSNDWDLNLSVGYLPRTTIDRVWYSSPTILAEDRASFTHEHDDWMLSLGARRKVNHWLSVQAGIAVMKTTRSHSSGNLRFDNPVVIEANTLSSVDKARVGPQASLAFHHGRLSLSMQTQYFVQRSDELPPFGWYLKKGGFSLMTRLSYRFGSEAGK